MKPTKSEETLSRSLYFKPFFWHFSKIGCITSATWSFCSFSSSLVTARWNTIWTYISTFGRVCMIITNMQRKVCTKWHRVSGLSASVSVSGFSSFKNFKNQTTGCGDIVYYLVAYFTLSHPVYRWTQGVVAATTVICRELQSNRTWALDAKAYWQQYHQWTDRDAVGMRRQDPIAAPNTIYMHARKQNFIIMRILTQLGRVLDRKLFSVTSLATWWVDLLRNDLIRV